VAQAQAPGGSRDGERVRLGLRRFQRCGAARPKWLVRGAEAFVGVHQGGAWGAGELGVGNGLLDRIGVLVSGVPAASGLFDWVGNGAVLAAADSSSVAAARTDR